MKNWYKLEKFRPSGPRGPGPAQDPPKSTELPPYLPTLAVPFQKIHALAKKQYPGTFIRAPGTLLNKPCTNTAASPSYRTQMQQMQQPSVLVPNLSDTQHYSIGTRIFQANIFDLGPRIRPQKIYPRQIRVYPGIYIYSGISGYISRVDFPSAC